jgi:hypothetical protein
MIYPLIVIGVISAFMLISRNYANIVPLSLVSVLMFTAILYNTEWVGSKDIELFKKIIPRRNE